jgi:hypothetical protein
VILIKQFKAGANVYSVAHVRLLFYGVQQHPNVSRSPPGQKNSNRSFHPALALVYPRLVQVQRSMIATESRSDLGQR